MCYILCGLIVLVIEAHVLYPVWVGHLGDEKFVCYILCMLIVLVIEARVLDVKV